MMNILAISIIVDRRAHDRFTVAHFGLAKQIQSTLFGGIFSPFKARIKT